MHENQRFAAFCQSSVFKKIVSVDGGLGAFHTSGMVTFGMADPAVGFDPLFILLLALALEAYFGEMRMLFRLLPHPVVLVGRLIDFSERKLNRDKRSNMERAVRGLLTVTFICLVAGLAGWGVSWLTRHHPWGWPIELFLTMALLAQRGLGNHVRDVAKALESDGLEAGRTAVSHIVGRDVTQLDEHGVARAAIESCAENYSDGVVAPVFWFVLFGFPGLAVYKAVNTLDSMIGYRSERYRAFGMTAARLDDILNWVPARLSGLFIAMAATFAPTTNPVRALKIMLRDSGKHRSPNAGWPEGAMAGALNLALAGPRRYTREVVKDPWIGDGSAKATARDIRRALYVYWVACLINGAWVLLLALARMSLAEG